MTLEVVRRHEKLAPESGAEFRSMHRFLEPVSGACVRGLMKTFDTNKQEQWATKKIKSV